MHQCCGMGDEPADMLTWEQIQAQTMAQYGPASQPQRQHSTQQGDQPVPWWFSWAAAGVGFVSIVAIGSILTRGK